MFLTLGSGNLINIRKISFIEPRDLAVWLDGEKIGVTQGDMNRILRHLEYISNGFCD